jgi:transcriptional antiterminator RfaH
MVDLTWLLVATKSRSEFIARQQLERQGFQVCLPQITLRKRKQGTWQQVTEPMFPGYVFVAVVLGEHDIAPIRSTVGCLQVVRFGGHLIPLPASVCAHS